MASVSLSYQDVLGDPGVQGGAQSKAGTGAKQGQLQEQPNLSPTSVGCPVMGARSVLTRIDAI